MIQQTDDGSLIDQTGKVLHFSYARFKRDIIDGNCCFICGLAPDSGVQFNDEHVVPDWIVRRFGLTGRTLHLPNEVEFKYDRYTIPCCAPCNTLLSETYEKPLSRLVAKGRDAVYAHVMKDGPFELFTWLALVFLKTHLKDRHLRFHLDRRKPEFRIAELHDWDALHHIHCVIRAFYSGCAIDSRVFGSTFLLPVRRMAMSDELFDYGDFTHGCAAFVRFDDFAFVAVFNDCCGAWNALEDILKNVNGAVNGIQLREIAARLSAANLQMRSRPQFLTSLDPVANKLFITVKVPHQREMEPYDRELIGQTIYYAVKRQTANLRAPGLDSESLAAEIKTGRWTFLYDEDGSFVTEDPIQVDERLMEPERTGKPKARTKKKKKKKKKQKTTTKKRARPPKRPGSR
jgi:hypothetical protein